MKPIVQTLGAWTAAEQGAIFFENVANENTTSRRQLIIHEVMGRHCGWLAAATAEYYRKHIEDYRWLPEIGISKDKWDVHAVWIPEMDVDLESEVERLRKIMDESDCVNLFLSEGAGTEAIIRDKKAAGEKLEYDAFGHVSLDSLNPGKWYAERLKYALGAEKVLVQKSGYFARSTRPNDRDLDLIKKSASAAAEAALAGTSGVAALDMDSDGQMGIIPFPKIAGGKPFDIDEAWFGELLEAIGQPKGDKVVH